MKIIGDWRARATALTSEEKSVLGAMFVITALLFFLEMEFPRGQTSAMGYVIVVGLCLWLRWPGFVYLTIGTSLLLTVVGFFVSEPGPIATDLVNRVESVFAFCFTGVMVLAYKAKEAESLHAASVVGSSDDAIVSLTVDGIVTSWNPGATRLFGCTAQEAAGSSMMMLFSPESGEALREKLHEVLATRVAFDVDTKKTLNNGRSLELSKKLFPIMNASDALVGIGMIARDISARMAAERELIEAQRTAEKASLAKSEFLSAMSHEIRTPLNGVIGMTGLLLDTDLSTQQRKYAETALQSGETLLAVINDVLDFSKIEAGKIDLEEIDFDLYEVVESVGGMLAVHAAKKGLELASAVDHKLPRRVRGDPARLRQVLMNLGSNAVKFTEHGDVVMRADLQTNAEGTPTILFEVKDTGVGLSTEAQSRLFKAFAQADSSITRRFGGTGLGLAICSQLVKLMGGEIGVLSAPGVGSTFWFTVPLAIASSPAPECLDLRGIRTLVVDDNAVNRAILHEHIIAWQMRNGCAENGQQALNFLQAAAARGENYDVAILDMKMPGMDGLELARAIKSDPLIASTRLILLSSVGDQGLLLASRKAGVIACLTKPVRQSELYDCLVRAMVHPTDGAGSPEGSAAAEGHAATTKPHGAHCVLVAEDNVVNQEVALGILSSLGYSADVVSNGLQAVEAVSRKTYYAVLMDCQMPEMDGYTAASKIREIEGDGRHVPIIALTADVLNTARAKSLAAGMDDYITKPIKSKQLSAALKRWLPAAAASDGADVAQESPQSPEQAIMERFQQLEGMTPELLKRLSSVFLEDTQPRLEGLWDAVLKKDAEELARLAHTMKGSAANMGAGKMADICAELEEHAKTGDLQDTQTRLSDLEQEFARVRDAFSKMSRAS
jgi:PAS domain S-box-containing protein